MDSSPMMEEEEAMEVEQPAKDIFSSAHKESVTEAVIQTLRKNGVDTASLSQQGRGGGGGAVGGNGNGKIFGLSLEDGRQERRVTETNGSPCYLPKFFVTSIEFLRNHVKTEGLFRKAGSCVRQKQLRLFLEEGNADIPGNADPHDVASLLKQYLRELPVPLLTHSLSLILLECNQLLSDEKVQDSHSITKTEAILMSCLLLPTQHLLCLQILTNLLHDVAVHSNESRMDSNSLAVVLTPNIFSSQETKKGKKNAKGGCGVGPGDIKNMTSITTILIDQYHLIGQVPLAIDILSNEIYTQSLKNQYNTGGASRGKNKQRKKSLSTRETVSSLLRGTLNKIRGGGGGENKDESVYSPSASIDDSPDGLGPTASKRMALDDSSDLSGHNESGNSSSSSFSFNPRKRLFNKGTRSKKKYPFLRRAKKNVENVPLLSSDNTEGTQQQQQQQEEVDEPVSTNDNRQPSALPSPLLNSTTNLDLLTVSPLTTSTASRPYNTQPHTPGDPGASSSASPPVVSATDVVMESPLSSNYKFVSRTRRTYCRDVAPAVVRACPSPYSFQPPVERVPAGSQPVKLVRPVLTDHNSRKRRQVQFGQSGYHCGGFELLPKPFTFTPVGSNNAATSGRTGSSSVSNCAQLTSSTPLERKHKKEASRGRPENDYMIKGTSSTSETVTNNDSYLCAVENGRDRETPLRRKLYESSNINPSTTRGVRIGSNGGGGGIGRRANSMKVTPTRDVAPSTSTGTDENISKKGRKCVVKSQSMSSRGINTARSPWINRKGIEISEWII